jgi:uncharacterized membrane protein YdfJ with MMPL/SSD domain
VPQPSHIYASSLGRRDRRWRRRRAAWPAALWIAALAGLLALAGALLLV